MKLLNEAAARRRPVAILFDLDDTLYDYPGPHAAAMAAVRAKMAQVLKVTGPQFDVAFRQARDRLKGQLGETASSHSRLLYFQLAIEILGLSSQPAIALDLEQTYWRSLLMRARLFAGVEDYLVELRAAGLPLALVTDLTAQIQFRKLVYFGIDRHFDVVVTSEEAGIDKSGLKPFELALGKLALGREAPVWFIGDSIADIVASKQVLNAATFQKLAEGGDATPHAGADATFSHFATLRAWSRDVLGG